MEANYDASVENLTYFYVKGLFGFMNGKAVVICTVNEFVLFGYCLAIACSAGPCL
jgi:hypothetical protein